ncbi:hypothetical protein ACIQ7Q_09225 [Streptomyces sp. NPDC096176]|uniref:hypothetical protein n=1 Tax=Streptomyces sp. NPDC096176 TaxID=3366079 RepID=UPI00380D9015
MSSAPLDVLRARSEAGDDHASERLTAARADEAELRELAETTGVTEALAALRRLAPR